MITRWMRMGASAVLAAVLVLGMVVGSAPAAFAQATQSHRTADGRHQVVWEGDWELEDNRAEPGVGELLFFTNDLAILNMAFLPSGYDLEEIRDVVLGGVEEGSGKNLRVMDSGAYDNVAYELDTIDIEGVAFGIWIVVIDRGAGADTTAIIYGAPVPAFSQGMELAQSEITVDGEAVFKGIDPAGLQGLLGQPVASSGTSTTASTGNRSRTSSSSTSSSRTSSAAQSYTNPTWGYTVEYSAPWSTGANVGEFSVVNSSPVAVVGFQGLDLQGVPLVLAHDVVVPIFQDSLPVGSRMIANVVGGDRLLLAASTPDGVFVQELIEQPNGSVVMVTMAFQGDPDTVFALANRNLSVNGMPLFAQWDLL